MTWRTLIGRSPLLLAGIMAYTNGSTTLAQRVMEVLVQGDNVNIRAKATNTCEVVAQKHFGDVLRAKRMVGNWVEIEPPEDVPVYVFGDYLHGDIVKAGTLNVRAGPSGNYNIVGQLKRNDVVVRKGEKGDWIQIMPTPAMSLFISKDFVKPKNPELARQQVTPPQSLPPESQNLSIGRPAGADAGKLPVEVARVNPIPAPNVPAPSPRRIPDTVGPVKAVNPGVIEPKSIPIPQGQSLLPISGQGQAANRQGVISSYLFKGNGPSKYYLSIDTGEGLQIVCYLDNPDGQLNAYRGKGVMASGWDYWVKGQKLPLMVVDTIRVLP